MEIADNLAEQDVERSRAVVRRILDRVGALADLPWTGPPWRVLPDPTFRRLVIGDYIVFYRVVEASSRVWVLAVRHGRQRPPEPADLPPTE